MKDIFQKIWVILISKTFRLILLFVVALICCYSIYDLYVNYTEKSQIFTTLSLVLAFFIFSYQEINRIVIEKEEVKESKRREDDRKKDDEDRDKKQKELLDEIGKNVLEIRPFKEAFEIIPKLEEWLAEFEEKNTLIFYFPYTLCPGFWIDGGSGFINYINKLEQYNQDNYNNKFVLIGPSATGDTMFTKIIDRLNSNNNIEIINKSPKLLNLLNITTVINDNKSDCIDKIKNLYIKRIKQIKDVATNKNFIRIIELINTPNNLLSSSFVIKINSNNDQDVFFIDTFNFLSAKLPDLEASLGVESILQKDGIGILFDNPKSKLINNDKITNLFLSMFLESCCNENLCEVKNEIFK